MVASVTDRAAVRAALEGAGAVLHPATLHKPHVGTHSRQAFVDTNVTGTLTLLEEAVASGHDFEAMAAAQAMRDRVPAGELAARLRPALEPGLPPLVKSKQRNRRRI